jgi:hypothetical protein
VRKLGGESCQWPLVHSPRRSGAAAVEQVSAELWSMGDPRDCVGGRQLGLCRLQCSKVDRCKLRPATRLPQLLLLALVLVCPHPFLCFVPVALGS